MKLTKTKLKQIIREELTKVVEEYDPVLGYDVEPEPAPPSAPETSVGADPLIKLYDKYWEELLKERDMGDPWFDKDNPEWHATAENFLNWLEIIADGGDRRADKHFGRAEDGFLQNGVAFFKSLGIPLKK